MSAALTVRCKADDVQHVAVCGGTGDGGSDNRDSFFRLCLSGIVTIH